MESARLVCFYRTSALSTGLVRECRSSWVHGGQLPKMLSSSRLREQDARNYALSLPLHLTISRMRCSSTVFAEGPLESEEQADDANIPLRSFLGFLDAFCRFTRPHTIIGTSLSTVSVSLLAVQTSSDLSWVFFARMSEVLVASLLMNVYIVGLNQMTDIEIDKINKPFLPLASGEFSITTGAIIVVSFAVMSFWISFVVGSWQLFCALFFSFILGTAYSINLPILRWKRSPILAAICIVAVRALIVQLLFFMHMQVYVFKRAFSLSKAVVFATAFMGFFSTVIALFKDIPDIKGDKIYGIKSFTVSFGQEKVFWTSIALLEIAYAVAILVGLGSPMYWSKFITIISHSILGMLLWNRAKSVDLNSKSSITSCYMFIWKLFYAEYFIIPFVK